MLKKKVMSPKNILRINTEVENYQAALQLQCLLIIL